MSRLSEKIHTSSTCDKDSPSTTFWLPFTPNRYFNQHPRVITRAQDMHYYTDDGRMILDAAAGLWCCNAGHNRKPIVDALQKSAATLDYVPTFQFSHPSVFALASKLAALAPKSLDHVFFTNSGSEAVDTALKIALAYWNRMGKGAKTRLIGRHGAYHGVGFGGISVGGIASNRKHFGPLLPGVDHLPSTYHREHQAFSRGEPAWGGHLADTLSDLIALHDASTIAAVIVEPMAGSAGVFPPPQGYLQKLRALCDAHDILLIFDEVITGFGRLGWSFAAERYGVVPDMLVFAKGVTSGAAPLGGVLVKDSLYDGFMQGPDYMIELYHGYTYSGHPLGCAAALAALDLYEAEGLFERARTLEPLWGDVIQSLCDAPNVVDVRTIGLVAGIDLSPMPGLPGKRGFRALEAAFRHHDLMFRVTGDTIALTPPLIISEEQINQVAQKLRSVLKDVALD
jgi:beta-alanine--pyruvate transaminase